MVLSDHFIVHPELELHRENLLISLFVNREPCFIFANVSRERERERELSAMMIAVSSRYSMAVSSHMRCHHSLLSAVNCIGRCNRNQPFPPAIVHFCTLKKNYEEEFPKKRRAKIGFDDNQHDQCLGCLVWLNRLHCGPETALHVRYIIGNQA